jgi:hypothetical protein
MCQPQPERTPMAMYERPEPTTLRPTSRPIIHNDNCCLHCQSGIDKSDKVCSRCGAPNENYKQEVKRNETWGELIRTIENTEPCQILLDASIQHEKKYLEKYLIDIEDEISQLSFDNSFESNKKKLGLQNQMSKIIETLFPSKNNLIKA